jgi:IclR family acetate operon transcriptional repressor
MKQKSVRKLPTPVDGEPQSGVQSVTRALDLLEAFPKHGPEIGLTQIANLLQLNKATAYRLLSTLEERGYVQRSPENRKYRLGVQAFELGLYFQNQLEVRRIALPFLRAMVEQTHEAAFLCVREGDQALCVERVESEHEVNIFALRVGGKQPLHWGGAPRALLSGLDEAGLEAYAARTGLPGITPHTLTTLEQLKADVQQTRQKGYVLSVNDVTLGIAAIGAPVFDHSGCVVASVSLSGLTNRFNPEHISEVTQIVLTAADSISSQLGFRASLTRAAGVNRHHDL